MIQSDKEFFWRQVDFSRGVHQAILINSYFLPREKNQAN